MQHHELWCLSSEYWNLFDFCHSQASSYARLYIYLFKPFVVLAKQSTLRGRSKISIDLILPSIVLVLIDFHLNKSQATLAKVRSSLDSKISISKGKFLTQIKRERRGQNGTEITLAKTSGETTLTRLCQLKNKSTKSIYTDRIQR